jgi:hypothetical protein
MAEPTLEGTPDEPLKFKVASHIVQDLGLNLYTSLPRVLVEFVANAYDADSPTVRIEIDIDAIKKAREIAKAEWSLARAKGKPLQDNLASKDIELERMTLPEIHTLTITDAGHGMTRDDIQNKFLVAGRRRRDDEKTVYTPKKRVVMGRKGLGKLAGFGVAHRVVVTSKKAGDDHATEITLDYDELIKAANTEAYPVPARRIAGGAGLGTSGTRILLSHLVYEPMKSDLSAVASKIGDHFVLVSQDDFAIFLGKEPVQRTKRKWAYAFPNPELAHSAFVEHTYDVPDAGALDKVTFQYRIRFTEPKQNLAARERGVRVYAHKRLASAPDLLDVETGMHGFRLTDYLDGEVHADVIDDQPTEYIATDRQSLRWEAPLLAPMRAFLSEQMKEACKAYQKVRDEVAKKEAKEDSFTQDTIAAAKLPKHREKFAFQLAGKLAAVSQGGASGFDYKEDLRLLVDGLAHGTLLKNMGELATQNKPQLKRLVAEATELMHQELGEFVRFAHGRLDGIAALEKIVNDVDFKKQKNEDELHRLFDECPWLIDPSFSFALVSDKGMTTFLTRLSKDLQIGKNVPKGFDATTADEAEPGKKNTRPDLVFLLGSQALGRVIIVELKAPNTPLHDEHLRQLENYMRKTRKFLAASGMEEIRVEGYLIGSRAKITSNAEEVEALNDRIKEYGATAPWKVFDLLEIVKRTRNAHKELVDIYEKELAAAAGPD